MAEQLNFPRSQQTEQRFMYSSSYGKSNVAATQSSAEQPSTMADEHVTTTPMMTEEQRAAHIAMAQMAMAQMTGELYPPISYHRQPTAIPEYGRHGGSMYGLPTSPQFQPIYSPHPLQGHAPVWNPDGFSPYGRYPEQRHQSMAYEPNLPMTQQMNERPKNARRRADLKNIQPYNPLCIRRWQCCKCSASRGYNGPRFYPIICRTCEHLRCTECIDGRADGSHIQTCGGRLLSKDRKQGYQPSIGGKSLAQRAASRAAAASSPADTSSFSQQTAFISSSPLGALIPTLDSSCAREARPISERLQTTISSSASETPARDGLQDMQATIRNLLARVDPAIIERSQASNSFFADKTPAEGDSQDM